MKTLMIMIILLLSSVAEAKDIQLFNPDLLGQSTAKEFKLLQDKKGEEIEPIGILVNSKNGRYIAATVIYPKEVTFQEAREALNKIYRKYENESLLRDNKMALWRVEDKKFAVDLIREEDQQEHQIEILYIQFQSTEEIMKEMLKSMGADMENCNKK